MRKETQEGLRLGSRMGGRGGGSGQAYRAAWRWKGIPHLGSQPSCECVSPSNDVSKSSLTPCPARLTPRGSGALQESAVACLWSDQRAGARSGPLKFTRPAVGAGAPRGRSAGPSGSLSLGWGSRCQLHASNFRLNPGSLPGPREPCSSALGSGRQPPGVCLLILLPAYQAGASRDSEQPPKEAAEVGVMHAVSFCRTHLDARVCWWVCVPVCVSEGVSVPVSVCVCHES